MTTGNSPDLRAAMDMGSNSFRLLVAPPGNPGAAALKKTVTVGLGRGGQTITPEAAARGLDTLAGFVRAAASFGITARDIRACGTEMLRRADNRAGFLRRAAAILGRPVEVLTGEEEARLTLAGIQAGMGTAGEDALVADIGGRSTELVFRKNGAIHAASAPTGAIQAEKTLRRQGIGKAAAEVRQAIAMPGEAAGCGKLILSGGSATTCAAISLGLEPYDPAAVNGHRMEFAEIEAILARLAATPPEELSLPGLARDRAGIIAGGVLVVREVMRIGGFASATVSDHGLLEGIFISAWPEVRL